MLSILIPIYNYDLRPLVQSLLSQMALLPEAVEVHLLDDGSQRSYQQLNGQLDANPAVIYEELPHNIGRAAIRNRLSERARHPYLLFLDNDLALPDAHFLRRYLDHIQPDTVLCGGLCYPQERPDQPQVLHWKYGHERESRPADKRCQRPYASFLSSNFVVPAKVFARISFDERLRQYGHEDTLFGQALANQQIPIRHLDNPVIHLGLDTTDAFLDKTRRAIDNLLRLRRSGVHLSTSLLKAYDTLECYRLTGMTHCLLARKIRSIENDLNSTNPSLRSLDVYKLYYLLDQMVSSV